MLAKKKKKKKKTVLNFLDGDLNCTYSRSLVMFVFVKVNKNKPGMFLERANLQRSEIKYPKQILDSTTLYNIG